MGEERPITPEQAMLAVKAAGLDPDKPLNEQLQGNGGLERQVVELSEQVKALFEARAAPTDPTCASASSPRTSGMRSTKT
jgi:hypothetical protein